MRDRVTKFGSFGGIDANCGNYAGGNNDWLASLEGAPAWGHRDAIVGARELVNTGQSTASGLTAVGNLHAQPRLRAILDAAGFSFINNYELETVDPIKGTTGSDAVVGVGTEGTGDDALVWNASAKPLNARWKSSVMANAYPNKTPLSVYLVGNEPDGNGNRLSAYAPTGVGVTIDGFSQVAKLDRTVLLQCLMLLAKAAYEELRTNKRQWAKFKHPSVVASYANTGTAMQNLNPPSGLSYSIYHFFNHNNGEALLYCDVIANHFHNFASAFDTSGVANNVVSPWHLWTAIQQGQALAGTGAVHPVYCNEGGTRETNLPAPQRSAWNYPETFDNLLARRLLKVRRQGMMLCTLFYWGYSYWSLYNHNASGDDGMIWCPTPNFTPREPVWTAIKRQFDPSLYMVTGRHRGRCRSRPSRGRT
jgi:hypothetical protein